MAECGCTGGSGSTAVPLPAVAVAMAAVGHSRVDYSLQPYSCQNSTSSSGHAAGSATAGRRCALQWGHTIRVSMHHGTRTPASASR